jgi:tRNA A-37 threonylcarbamoyl transferase component Bud32
MGAMMALGAVVWSGLSLAFGLILPGTIPLGYIALTVLNFSWFAASKRFERTRAIQIFFSVLLPFVFQWSVGGFYASGAVMLWALVAVVCALAFTRPRAILGWLVMYAALVVFSGTIDAWVRRRFPLAVPDEVKVTFFVINFVMISAVVVALMVYFLVELADAKAAIAGLREEIREARRLGQYTLVEKVGEGGMGAVYRARHAMLRRPTALKMVRPDRADEATIARFEREVQLTATLTHPNTITIYDYGRTDDGTFYYAMEYLDGADLGVIVKRSGPMPVGRVVHVIAQVAQALAEAHRKGLIHRDIKPANVILTQAHVADLVKVVDFGLVKVVKAKTDAAASTTQDGAFTGTPAYMSPEALTRPDGVDGRCDVYALGCVAYTLLTGGPVFSADTVVEICGHHLHTAPIPPSVRAGRDVPEPLEALVLRCLAKKVDDRPSSDVLAAELADLTREPWASWTQAEATAWWRAHGPELAAARAEHAETLDTIVERAG